MSISTPYFVSLCLRKNRGQSKICQTDRAVQKFYDLDSLDKSFQVAQIQLSFAKAMIQRNNTGQAKFVIADWHV